MSDPPLRVGIWCAVSSKAQAQDDKASLPAQEGAGREFARALGAQVVAVYRVPGHSRDIIFYTDAEKAIPAYRRLRADIETGRLDVLWALDVDRLGRDPALGQQVISLVEKAGGEVYLTTAPHQVGTKTIGHRYITAIQAVRAGEDQARRVDHWQKGMAARVASGLHPGIWPHGYRAVRDPSSGRVVAGEFDPETIQAVKLITRLFLAGKSYPAIVRTLNGSPHAAPRSARWRLAVVYHICHNDHYAGFVRWRGEVADRPSDRFPALWDPDTHRAIIQERKRRAMPGGYSRRESGPLRGVAFCGRCGSAMVRSRSGSGLRYLSCGRHATASRTGIRCHPNYVKEKTVLAQVAAFLDALKTPGAVDQALARLDPGPGQAARAELAAAQDLARSLESQRRRLALALAKGAIDPDMYRDTDDTLKARLKAAQAQAQDLARTVAALPDLAARRAHLENVAAQGLAQLLETKDPATVAAGLQKSGIRVIVENGIPVVGVLD